MFDLEILKWLDGSILVESFNVLEFRQRQDILFLKLEVFFIDNSELYTSEYLDENVHNYSFHWQDKDGNLIMRWDNAPYHKNILTFPHHLHRKKQENIEESLVISLKEVLEFIEKQIQSLNK